MQMLRFPIVIALLAYLVTGAHASASSLSASDRSALETMRAQAQCDLTSDILPFWTRETLDPKFGGFNTVVDRYGKPTSDIKYVIMQARMIWTLSAAWEFGIHNERYKSLAANGVKFMTQKMWDPKYGGFYMSVKRDGTPDDTRKEIYAQEFALYGLSEYARVFHDKIALERAKHTWAVIQRRAADPRHGGYREDFDRSWHPISASLGVTGAPSGKTINVHMHLMEALTAFYRANPTPANRKALESVVDVIRAKAMTNRGYILEPFSRDWTPVPDGSGRMTTFYGHDVEMAWLMRDTYVTLGRDPKTIEPTLYALIDDALTDGFDWNRGGLAFTGPRVGKAFGDPKYASDLKQKDWWEQAELLTALSTAYRYTHKKIYLDALQREWSWVWKYQIDHKAGDWYTDVDFKTGAPLTLDKGAGGWKVCYHDGRALMNLIQQLNAILGEAQASCTSSPKGSRLNSPVVDNSLQALPRLGE
jgi:mannobiose 2-epimerase